MFRRKRELASPLKAPKPTSLLLLTVPRRRGRGHLPLQQQLPGLCWMLLECSSSPRHRGMNRLCLRRFLAVVHAGTLQKPLPFLHLFNR
jgi:hypothetical protein